MSMASRNTKSALWVSAVLNVLLLGVLLFGFSQNEDVIEKNTIPEVKIPAVYTNLPSDIDPGQIARVYDGQYALAVKGSMNIDLSHRIAPGFAPSFAGVLKWNSTENRWDKAVTVTDTDTSVSSGNNPVELTWDMQVVPHLLVVDTNGGGSGEGTGKILIPRAADMKEWNVIDCFEYGYDWGKGKKMPLSSKECQSVKVEGII